MTSNLIVLFKNSIGDTLVRECSGLLGESAQSISSSMDAIIPSILSAMIMKGNTDQGVGSLLDFISGNGLNEASFNASGNEELITKGSVVLNYLYGNHLSPVIDSISAAGGLKTSSSSSLLKMVAPLVLGFFGRFVKENSLSSSGAKDLLVAQNDLIKQNIPASISELLAYPNVSSSPASSTTNSEMMTYNPPTGISKFLPWIVLLLASLGLFYFLQKGCNTTIQPEKMPPTETRDTI
ncbi:MAG: DUF937 domain-containing protein [Saprospiraceae bacterium]|uniref:DUF937 domain-containing protein n=1 Tax=Candidatus Opimibacter skivensis TaxID=2982028 RepID=A0A9D7XLK1_9BACT|nr:DUF937 domain-containing protein [Candidatus Opimibacter skivensis]